MRKMIFSPLFMTLPLLMLGAGCVTKISDLDSTPVVTATAVDSRDEANKTTEITYSVSTNTTDPVRFCDGSNMDSKAYKNSLTNKVTQTVSGHLTTEEKIKKTLSLAAEAQGFHSTYTQISNVTFENGKVIMHSANGWAGASIFYCAWTPFVEKNLEQFSEVKEIQWQAGQN